MSRAVLVLLLLGCASSPGVEGSQSIFDGRTLSGWVPRGGGKFSVDGGTILCETGDGRYGWLCSQKKYGDFILGVEVKFEGNGNSGIQVRSAIDEKDLMVGYQFDLDRTRPSSGRLYDEARRKLLQDVPLKPECRNAIDGKGWNTIRAECVADHLRSWVNGVPIADYVDSVDIEGILALQVHSGLKDPVRLRFRNLRIQDLGRRKWKTLYQGSPVGAFSRDLETGDFTVRLQFKGSGALSASVSREGVLGFSRMAQAPPPSFKPGEWNSITVSARGTRLAVHLNDILVSDATDAPARTGRLLLQVGAAVEVRKVEMLGPPE